MKFGITIPDSWLPKALQSETRALKDFLKSDKKRVSVNLTRRRTYVADMKQDELKHAIVAAREPQRPRRDLLYAIYEECLPDGHFTGEYEKAINKVVGSPFAVFKKGTDEIDEVATGLLQKDWFEDYRTHFEEAVFWGHSLVQFLELEDVIADDHKQQFTKVELVPREHVRPEEGFVVFDTSWERGIPFREEPFKSAFKFIEMGKSDSLGKLRIIAREYIWKNYSRTDWSSHSEKFGKPIVAIKTATRDSKELDKLEQMAENFGTNLWMILDEEDNFELKETTFKDAYNIYKEKVLMCNDEMSKAATWQTGTSDEKAFVGGAEVHERILDDYTEWRKRKQTYHVNDTLIPFLIKHGYPLKDRVFKYLTYQEANPNQEKDEADNNSKKGAGGDGSAKKHKPGALFKYRIK